MMRKIIHIDMDAYYASVEQGDTPEFRGKPLAVGYPGERGVVAAASYEARKYGVRSAMPSKTALKRCPWLIFTPGRFEVYREVSNQIRDIVEEAKLTANKEARKIVVQTIQRVATEAAIENSVTVFNIDNGYGAACAAARGLNLLI